MFCAACRRYRPPWRDRAPAFCGFCGQPTTLPERARLDEDIRRLRYLLDELRDWSDGGLIHQVLRDRLAAPYEQELELAGRYVEGFSAIAVRAGEPPDAPRCHESDEFACPFCPECGVHLASWRAHQAAGAWAAGEAAPLVGAPSVVEMPSLVAAPPPVVTAPLGGAHSPVAGALVAGAPPVAMAPIATPLLVATSALGEAPPPVATA